MIECRLGSRELHNLGSNYHALTLPSPPRGRSSISIGNFQRVLNIKNFLIFRAYDEFVNDFLLCLKNTKKHIPMSIQIHPASRAFERARLTRGV